MNRPLGFLLVPLICLAGCGGSEKYPQLPADVNPDAVPKQTAMMTAERYTFSPQEVHAKAGTLVTVAEEPVRPRGLLRPQRI
jgi:hypothetical protein